MAAVSTNWKRRNVDVDDLRKWAVEDLRIPGLSEQWDPSYVFRGEMSNFWEYLINNITNKQSARAIRGNIQLQRQTATLSRADDASSNSPHSVKVKRYHQLLRQLNKQRSELSQLEESVESHRAQLSLSAQASHRSKANHREMSQKCCLFSQHRKVLADQLQVLAQFREKLVMQLNKLDKKMKTEMAVKVQLQSSTTPSQNVQLMQLREILTSVSDFLYMLLSGETSESSLQQRKTHIKNSITELTSCAEYAQLVTYLVHEINRTKDLILTETENIDYIKDAECLRFKVVAERLVDESREPSLLLGVNELVEKRQVEHRQIFLETEKHRAEVVLYNKQQAELRERVYAKLSAGVSVTDSRYVIIREIIDKMVAERQALAALLVVNSWTENLQQEVKTASERLSSLKVKHSAIAGFRANVHARQNQICVLMKQNVTCKERLLERQALVATNTSMLCSNVEPLNALTSSTVAADYTAEARQLQTIPLSSLSHPHSVVRGLSEVSGKASADIDRLCKLLGFDGYLASDAHLRKVVERKHQILTALTRLPPKCSLGDLQLAHNLHHVLLPQATHENSKLVSKLVPMLQKSRELVERTQSKCDKLDHLIDDWWQQPALKLDLAA